MDRKLCKEREERIQREIEVQWRNLYVDFYFINKKSGKEIILSERREGKEKFKFSEEVFIYWSSKLSIGRMERKGRM